MGSVLLRAPREIYAGQILLCVSLRRIQEEVDIFRNKGVVIHQVLML